MKNIFKLTIWIFLIGLIAANIGLFCSSLNLSDQIGKFESKAEEYHKENLNLIKKLSSLSSLKFALDKAEALQFTKKESPIYLDNKFGVALNFAP